MVSWMDVLTVIGVMATIILGTVGIGLGVSSYWQGKSAATKKGQENIHRGVEKLTAMVDNLTKSNSPELEKRFSEGFTTFGVTARRDIIRASASYGIEMTWDSATISDLTPSNLTMQLQNVKIIRTQTTPAGTQPAGEFLLNGKAIWQIDRKRKLVSINNAVNLWGFVIGGHVVSDENDMLIVAVGLQKVE
jgi:hypothetical protein